MKKCNFCGANLPENTRFCGKCGSVQNALTTSAAATGIYTPQSQSRAPYSNVPTQGSGPAWSPNGSGAAAPPSIAEEDERRRELPPWSPVYGPALGGEALLGSGQVSLPGAPVVTGTPQIGNVPAVAGTSTPSTNAPASPPLQGSGNAAPVSHPIQAPGNAAPVSAPSPGQGNAPVSHPAPISHPVQGPTHMPVSHPVQRPQPVHQPPEQPGMQGHPPTHIHKHHRHHAHHKQEEHHRRESRPAQHHAARVTKMAGGSSVKTIILVVATVVLVAAGGIATASHFLSRSRPLISITSNYTVGTTPAGAIGTMLHISGQQFASNSAITFLLDGQGVPGNPGARSDSNGTFSTVVTITSAWSVGTHTLTARDASNDSTKNSVSVTIVQQGQASTPGPNGALPDDASFRINITVQGPYSDIADPFASNPVLIITGHPDPEGGTVCSPDDNRQSFTRNSTTVSTGAPYTQVSTATCSGTYKAGQISYIETDTSVAITWQDNGLNINCVQQKPAVDLQMTGAYAGNGTFTGTFNAPYIPYTCDQQGYGFHQVALNGTWTGTIVTQ